MFGSLKNKLKGALKKEEIKQKITQKSVSEEDVEKTFTEIESVLLQNSVAMEVIEKINKDIQSNLKGKKFSRVKFKKAVEKEIKKSIEGILIEPKPNEFLKKINSKKPFVILFIGVNGSGKTTTIARLANYFKNKKMSCVIAAGDTFRAASIEQLEVHGENLGIKVIKQNYGSDSAAVAYDAVKHAEAKGIDVVLIDTAGRQHSNINLMDELRKIRRVVNPDMTIFVGDSLTGNDAILQAQEFQKAVEFDYSILTKTDVDEKGGAILSIAYVTKKPILFLGTGQNYKDMISFRKKLVLEKLFK